MKINMLTFMIGLFGVSVFSQTINVPIDYHNPDNGYFELEYEFGNTYNPELPTVIVIVDAQQFYVRKGRIKKIQDELFGKDFNVLGIIPRNTNKELRTKVELQNKEETNWQMAYSVYQSYQCINDIDSVINNVLYDDVEIYMYGQSGGAFLITEYLSVFPNSRVKKVFVGASVNPVVENKLGILHDNFQRNYLLNSKEDKEKLDTVLSEAYFNRKLVASLFQRQNFFVELDSLNKQRSELVNRLYLKDTAYVNNLKKEYQIDAINNLFNSETGIPIRVRLSEFINPLLHSWKNQKTHFYPDLENSYNIAFPLLNLQNTSSFEISNVFDENEFRKFNGEVFILSGRHDHVADYRSSIYLCGLLNDCTLFIAEDDHTFKSLKANGDYARLIQEFFKKDNYEWIMEYNNYLWTEK